MKATILGIAFVIAVGLALDNMQETEPIEAVLTAYCPCEICCGEYFSDGITASGHRIKQGDAFVAAPPRFPFGTEIAIMGYGVVPVLDRGGAIQGNCFDVLFADY